MSDQIAINEVRRCACATIRRTDRVLTQFYVEILATTRAYPLMSLSFDLTCSRLT